MAPAPLFYDLGGLMLADNALEIYHVPLDIDLATVIGMADEQLDTKWEAKNHHHLIVCREGKPI